MEIERATLLDQKSDYESALSDANPDSLRQSKTSFTEISEKIFAVRNGIEQEGEKIRELDDNIQRLKKRLEGASTDLMEV